MSETKIILGMEFGDEGKGHTVSYLASLGTPNKLVIRFNGGHQAGHTAVYKGQRHVFSTFGSGTLQGIPTYISRFCTVYPFAFMNEWNLLKNIANIRIFIDPLAQIVTPFDIAINHRSEGLNQHGSCGVGFGTTIARAESHYNLYAQDLLFPSVLNAKLDNIMRYYRSAAKADWTMKKQEFLRDVSDLLARANISVPMMSAYKEILFEGAQGILLDQEFGFFPNVTRSYCTSRNALELIKEFKLNPPELYYVHRPYQTRHGIGFMTNEDLCPRLKNNENETNIQNTWQGSFRKGMLDVDLMKYALQCDSYFHQGLKKTMVLTCLDQVGKTFPGTSHGKVIEYNPISLYEEIGLTSDLLVSEGPETAQMYPLG